MLPQQYCLRWKYHHSNLQTMFSQLLDRGCFCDVTLACEGQTIKAHRVVLCACSTYFDAILTNCCSEKDPIIIMRDAKFSDIKCLIEFMYKGEINVEHGSLASLLKTAEELKIKGLAEVSWRDDEQAQHIENPSPELREERSLSQHSLNSNINTIPTTVGDQKHIPILTPINTSQTKDGQSNNHILPMKKKRGRPPLDAEFDSAYSKPKISQIENIPFQDSSHLVSVLMDDSSKDTNSISKSGNDNNNVSWPEQNLDTHMDYEDDEPTPNIIPKMERPETPFDGIPHPDDISSPNSPSDTGAVSAQPLFLTQQEIEEWKDVIKMNDYLTKGRRPQFWEEPFCKRVMDAIKNKNLEMKKAAQILGVSYGTLYGRYRETYGCLKHPYRGPFMVSRLREYWTDQAPAEILSLLQKGGLSLQQAAELMNTSPSTVSEILLEQRQEWLSLSESDKEQIDVDLDTGDESEVNCSDTNKRTEKDLDNDNNKENNKEKIKANSNKDKNNKLNDNKSKTSITLPNHPEVSLINVKKSSTNLNNNEPTNNIEIAKST